MLSAVIRAFASVLIPLLRLWVLAEPVEKEIKRCPTIGAILSKFPQ